MNTNQHAPYETRQAVTVHTADDVYVVSHVVSQSLQCQCFFSLELTYIVLLTYLALLGVTYKPNFLTLLTVNVNTRPSLCLCASDSLVTYGTI